MIKRKKGRNQVERRQVEILAPAGSYESMTAAVSAGADAVYMGGSRFGARAYADNPDEEKLLDAIDYMHLHGKRLYMTVNTLMKEEELGELFEYLNPYYKQGLDAAIVQDMGVFAFIKDHFPEMHLHASTQMTITGAYGAKLLKKLGAQRIVTARELSLEEIRRIRDQVDIEIESFVHGALCYCYSGQCLLSSVIGGRSGNRGRCAQPCRLPYEVKKNGRDAGRKNERYVMSLKDLCTLELIPDLIEAGVFSMKIEGRMKSPRYTAGVVSMYRKYTDKYFRDGREGYFVEPEDKQLLLDLFDRGGFTEGYCQKHNGKDMVALQEKPQFREVNQRLFDELDETYVNHPKMVEVVGKAVLKEGEEAMLLLSAGAKETVVYGQKAEPAQNQPITEEKLQKQMGKTGGTGFHFTSLTCQTQGRPFLPVQALNELRRKGFELLRENLLASYRRADGRKVCSPERTFSQLLTAAFPEDIKSSNQPLITASAESAKVAGRLANLDGISRIYLDSATIDAGQWDRLVSLCHSRKKECWLVMPHIFRTEAEQYFMKHKSQWKRAGFDGMLLGSLEEVEFLKEQGIRGKVAFDGNLYTFNRVAEQVMKNLGADWLTLPWELNERELGNLGCKDKELLVYGYLPLMVSAQCIKKTTEGCSRKPELLYMKDRMGKEFPVRNQCRFCYNVIYNTSPLSLSGQEERIKKLRPASVRLAFTIENEEQASAVAEGFIKAFQGEKTSVPVKDFTRGHFKRGVE